MCFAAVGKAIFGHPEVAVGLVPGGGHGSSDVDAPWRCSWVTMISQRSWQNVTAISIGHLPTDELTPFVEKLAHRIASFPAHAIAHAKAAVDTGVVGSMAEGLLVEAHESDVSVVSEVTQALVTKALKVGAETYESELEMEYLSKLYPMS